MAKADLSDDVIKIAIGAILVGGIYLIYTSSRAGQPIITATQETGAAVQKPFVWTAEGLEWYAGGFAELFNPKGTGDGNPNWAKRRQESSQKSWLKGEEGYIPDWIY